jgi:hypothetical protein
LAFSCDPTGNRRRLALVVQNARLNADLQRACSVLQKLEIVTSINVCAGRSIRTLYRP